MTCEEVIRKLYRSREYQNCPLLRAFLLSRASNDVDAGQELFELVTVLVQSRQSLIEQRAHALAEGGPPPVLVPLLTVQATRTEITRQVWNEFIAAVRSARPEGNADTPLQVDAASR
jgi:hypothetical protein